MERSGEKRPKPRGAGNFGATPVRAAQMRRRPPSIRQWVWSISCWPVLRASGSPRTGRSAPWLRPPILTGRGGGGGGRRGGAPPGPDRGCGGEAGKFGRFIQHAMGNGKAQNEIAVPPNLGRGKGGLSAVGWWRWGELGVAGGGKGAFCGGGKGRGGPGLIRPDVAGLWEGDLSRVGTPAASEDAGKRGSAWRWCSVCAPVSVCRPICSFRLRRSRHPDIPRSERRRVGVVDGVDA